MDMRVNMDNGVEGGEARWFGYIFGFGREDFEGEVIRVWRKSAEVIDDSAHCFVGDDYLRRWKQSLAKG